MLLRPGPVEGAAVFEIPDAFNPAIHFAAVVDVSQFGLALAYALKVSVEFPAYQDHWREWEGFVEPLALLGSTWLSTLAFHHHPSKGWHYDGIDQANEKRYR